MFASGSWTRAIASMTLITQLSLAAQFDKRLNPNIMIGSDEGRADLVLGKN